MARQFIVWSVPSEERSGFNTYTGPLVLPVAPGDSSLSSALFGHLHICVLIHVDTNIYTNLKVKALGSGETSPWLRALAALAEDLGSVPVTHGMGATTICNSSPGNSKVLSGHHRHVVQTHTQTKHLCTLYK